VPFQAVDGCARPGPCGGIGFTQGLSGLKRAFEFPMLRLNFLCSIEVSKELHSEQGPQVLLGDLDLG
jgi:hypothetical protein